MPPPPIAWIVRDVDKHAADLRGACAAVLLCLAEHCNQDDECAPGLSRIERSSGLSHGAVGDAIRELVERGLVDRSTADASARLRTRLPARSVLYWLDREALGRLPRIESATSRPIEASQSANGRPIDDVESATDGQAIGQIPAPSKRSIGHSGGSIGQISRFAPLVEGRDQKAEIREKAEKVKAERSAPPSSDLDLAFVAADEAADHHRRPRASRGEASTAALDELVIEAKAAVELEYPGAWPQALGARLRLHYEREEEGLASRRWPLKLALQVEQPRPVVNEIRHVHMGDIWLDCTTRIGPYDLVEPTRTLLQRAQTTEEQEAERAASRRAADECALVLKSLPPPPEFLALVDEFTSRKRERMSELLDADKAETLAALAEMETKS